MISNSGPRILAIDVRRNRFGYVLFEGPMRLLDWGASAVSAGLEHREALEVARKRVLPLFRRCRPAAAVVKRPRRTKTGKSSAPGPVLGTVLRGAIAFHVPVHFVSRDEILRAFRDFGSRNKDDIAEALVKVFPELITKLPPRRGKWGTERSSMVIFDALATSFAFWQRSGTPLPQPQ